MRKAITIGIVLVMVLMGFVALANPVVSNEDPTGTIEKSMDDVSLWLGDYVWITLDVVISGGTLTVKDQLPEYLSYISGTFTVDPAVSQSPMMKKGAISIDLGPGTYTIMFQVIFDSAPAENHWDVNTAYLKDGKRVVDDDSVDIEVLAYCGFHKYATPQSGPIVDYIVPLGVDFYWDFKITLQNLYPWEMTNPKVWDRFGAELEVDDGPYVTQGTPDIKTKGKSEKVFLTWDVGALGPIDALSLDDYAELNMVISTDLNPAGKQEYTSPGDYLLNSGAVLKFKNFEGIQLSAHTPSIEVTVV